MKKRMAKLLAALMCVMTVAAFMPAMAFADEGETAAPAAGSVKIHITISNQGDIVVPYRELAVEDVNSSGSFDIYDAFYCAHRSFYKDGADGFYADLHPDYGTMSIFKFWGIDTQSVTYFNNNAMAWGLDDPVKDGDSLYAGIIVDFSEHYSYFDACSKTAESGKPVTLKLTAATGEYDETWTPIMSPYSGASVGYYDSNKKFVTLGTTDSEGNVTFAIKTSGTYVVTATGKSGDTLIPPVCIVTVKADPYAVGTYHTVSGTKYKITSATTVAITRAKNAKTVTVPASVSLNGKKYSVNKIASKAFKGSKATKVVVKSKKLTKASVRNCFKSSKVKTVQVKVGSKKTNKTYVKKYKKIFTKKNAGKKVTVK